MKTKLKIFVCGLLCILCGIGIFGCEPKMEEKALVKKNDTISGAITNIKNSLAGGGASPTSFTLLTVENPAPSAEGNFIQAGEYSYSATLLPSMMQFLKRVADSGKVDLYGDENQIVEGIILDDNQTTMKFRLIVEEENNYFAFELAGSGALYYNAYICLIAEYDYDAQTLTSANIVVDMTDSAPQFGYYKYEQNDVYELQDTSSVESNIESNYNSFKQLNRTTSLFDFVEEYGE